MDYDILDQQQNVLAKKVVVNKNHLTISPQEIVFTLDVQYEKDEAYIACDIAKISTAEHQKTYLLHTTCKVPYASGYFSFREGPVLLDCIEKVIEKSQITPDLIIIDGHGTAHPREFGVACYVGVHLDIPTIGCAKRSLLKYDGIIEEKRGGFLGIKNTTDNIIGYILRTQDKIKPLFVSAGHRISHEEAKEIILNLSHKYRLIEPIRRADHSARSFAKQQHFMLENHEIIDL